MRHTILGMGFGMMFIIFLACYMTMSDKAIRQNELDRTIDRAVEQTVKALAKSETGMSREDFVTDFFEGIIVSISSNSNIEIDCMKYDEKKGLISLTVKAHFTYPNGHAGTVKANRTFIMESS